jgi:hypothetical protein
MLLTIRRHTKNYRKPLHLQHTVAFLFVVVVVVFFFGTAVDSTSVTVATDAAAAAATTADKLIVDNFLVEHEQREENSNYGVLRGTSSAVVTAGKLSLSNTSNHTVHLASSHQRQQHTQQKQQSQKVKEEKEKEDLTPTKFIGVDYKGDPVYMPLIGTGTWQYDNTTAYESVCQAFGAGYSFVDTAYGYKNQQGVGRAIKDCWKGNRTDLFVMTKIPGKFF